MHVPSSEQHARRMQKHWFSPSQSNVRGQYPIIISTVSAQSVITTISRGATISMSLCMCICICMFFTSYKQYLSLGIADVCSSLCYV